MIFIVNFNTSYSQDIGGMNQSKKELRINAQYNKQMQETQKLGRCENCNKQIDECKLSIHEAYCLRNFKKCNECEQMYDINLRQQHEQQYHTKQKCPHCDKLFLQSEIFSHKNKCAPTLIQCQYCDLNVPQVIFADHLKGCESRTTTCEICQHPIPNKNYKNHEEECLNNLCTNNGKLIQKSPINIQHGKQQHVKGRKRVKQDKEIIKPRSVAVEIFKNSTQKKQNGSKKTKQLLNQIICLQSDESNKTNKSKANLETDQSNKKQTN